MAERFAPLPAPQVDPVRSPVPAGGPGSIPSPRRWTRFDPQSQAGPTMGLRHWQFRDSGDSDILCTKRQQRGNDFVMEGQPLPLFI
jgi:hypothetical protein